MRRYGSVHLPFGELSGLSPAFEQPAGWCCMCMRMNCYWTYTSDFRFVHAYHSWTHHLHLRSHVFHHTSEMMEWLCHLHRWIALQSLHIELNVLVCVWIYNYDYIVVQKSIYMHSLYIYVALVKFSAMNVKGLGSYNNSAHQGTGNAKWMRCTTHHYKHNGIH